MKKLNKKGFTLVELIVVIAILAVLAVIAIPMLSGWVSQGKNAKIASNVKTALSACNAAVAAAATKTDGSVKTEITAIIGGQGTVAGDDDGMTITFTDGSEVDVAVATDGTCTAKS